MADKYMSQSNQTKITIVLLAVGLTVIAAGGFYIRNISLRPTESIKTTAEQNTVATTAGLGGSAAQLTQEEIRGLTQMREEEKLARDVYTTLGQTWGTQIFSNISQSEQTHTDAVKALLNQYGLEDPVKVDTIGVFTDPTMQSLYATLVEEGKTSLIAALMVGAEIEDLDIYDLNKLQATTQQTEIKAVYENLTNGSKNHMRAFARQLATHGATYTARHLSQDEVSAILTGS